MGAMRKIALAVLVVLLPLSALAQSPDRPRRVSVFISNLEFGWSEGNGSEGNAGFGIAAEYRFTPRWSTELSVAREEHHSAALLLDEFDLRSYPVDLVARYHFLGVHTRWRPYAGLGARYVAAPDAPDDVHYENRLSAEANGGVDFNINQAWSLRFDVKRLLRTDDSAFDEETTVSIGAGWRF